ADDAGVFGQEEGLEGGRAPARLRLGHRQSAFGVHHRISTVAGVLCDSHASTDSLPSALADRINRRPPTKPPTQLGGVLGTVLEVRFGPQPRLLSGDSLANRGSGMPQSCDWPANRRRAGGIR